MIKLLIIIRKSYPFWTIRTQTKSGEDKQYHFIRSLFMQWFERVIRKDKDKWSSILRVRMYDLRVLKIIIRQQMQIGIHTILPNKLSSTYPSYYEKTMNDKAKQLFPNSPTMQQRWIEARKKADTLKPKYGLLLPMTEEVARWESATRRVDRWDFITVALKLLRSY